jgi:hypothetical protein
MASRDAIERMIDRLTGAYPRMGEWLTKPGTVAEWTNSLKTCSDDTVSDATTTVIRTRHQPPTISDMVEACAVVMGNDTTVRQTRQQEAAARDLKFAWEDYEIRLKDGQRGVMEPPGLIPDWFPMYLIPVEVRDRILRAYSKETYPPPAYTDPQ